MVENDAYCVDLLKELAAVQGTLLRVQQSFLRNHRSSCVSNAIKDGMGEAIIDALMGALKDDTRLIDGRGTLGADLLPAADVSGSVPAEHTADCCAPAPQAGATRTSKGKATR
jgi:hypothetical protein